MVIFNSKNGGYQTFGSNAFIVKSDGQRYDTASGRHFDDACGNVFNAYDFYGNCRICIIYCK